VGLERLGYVVSLKKWLDGGWTCSFHKDAATSADGFGSGATPWRAAQQTAWVVVKGVA
jgi:hypothetical protein